MLNISFLGKSKFEYDGKIFSEQLGTKAIALICLLALNEKRYLSRDKMIGYLWPDSNSEAAKYNLRYNLWLIKKNIEQDKNGHLFLRVDNDCCCINKEYEFECDILHIMKFRPNQDDTIEGILKLKRLFRGDLLEGCYFNKCDELNEIIIFERINFEQRKVKILKRLVELYEENNNYDACLEIINEILEIEPYDEEMVLKILDIYSKCGKQVAAITYYNNFSNVLAGSLGISPSYELRNKYSEIRGTLEDYDNNEEFNKNTASKLAVEENRQGDINIVSDCMKNIEYFWISNVIENILSVVDANLIKQLSRKELLDLGYIQSNILSFLNEELDNVAEYGQQIMGVSIINAFMKLLTNICKKQNLTIVILNSKDMDEVSFSVLKYLRRHQIEGLVLVEE
jgi:DNA-binding SARP family transcriptional activator